MKYILTDEAVTITPPSGLYLVVEDVEGTGSITIADGDSNALTTSPLPQSYPYPITVTASGSINVTVLQAGDQSAYHAVDRYERQPNNRGQYPGAFGRGTAFDIDKIPPTSH